MSTKKTPQKRKAKAVATPIQADRSPKITQRDKINYDLRIRDFNWTPKQQRMIDLFLHKDTKLLLVKGCAGVSKTLLSVYLGLKLLEAQSVSELIFIRSAVESADNKLGYLKGDMNLKFEPYITPFHEKLEELITPSTITRLENEERIKYVPNNFLRGTQFSVKYVFCDEAQNLSLKEHLTLMTRIGQRSKVIIGGDPDQCDIPKHKSGFLKVFDAFNNEESEKEGIYTFEFLPEDNMRSPVSRFITEKFQPLLF